MPDNAPPGPPDLTRHTVAISRHYKRFNDIPAWLWDNEHACWVDAHAIETWAAVYRDRVLGFFIDPVTGFADHKLVMLMVATSYIEGHEQYRQAKSSKNASASMFKESMRRLFSFDGAKGLDRLYEGVRCGLFHDGMTRAGVAITGESKSPIFWWTAPGATTPTLVVNPILWLETVRRDLEDYVVRISKPVTERDRVLRENFEQMWRTRALPAGGHSAPG